MTKHRWRESNSFANHIDPEKDEQLNWIQIEIDNKVKRASKLIKSINQGNKEANSKKKSELLQLIQDFHKQYQSLYALYDNLKGEVRRKINPTEDDISASSDSESYYSPDDTSVRNSKNDLQKLLVDTTKQETPNLEEAYLKDKLTSTSEVVKQALNVEPDQSEESNNQKLVERGKENLELRGKISELETKVDVKENELCVCMKKNDELMAQAKTLQSKVASLCVQKEDLEEKLLGEKNKEYDQIKSLTDRVNLLENELGKKKQELSDCVIQLENLKGNLANKNVDGNDEYNVTNKVKPRLERKMEEMAEEFRNKFEDKIRILSRRIRVAEQLHVENKDWYRKTKDNHEIGLSKIKDISLTANDTLMYLDKMCLKLEECSANFMNRTSKVSCELKFAKDWVMRKNKAILHVKEDLDCLLGQLDDKEAEILVFRQKVWKCENKVRELEKVVKEREEGMLGLQEEKREAIRQLCIWIDYHRSRSDYLKKLLCERTVRNNKRTP